MAVSSLVRNLPFLRSLTIAKCNGLQSLQIKETQGLHKLVVLDCPQLQSLSFEGCCLNYFRYGGHLVSFRFELYRKCNSSGGFHIRDRGLPQEDAMLDLRQCPLTEWTWDFKPSFYPYYHGFLDLERNDFECANKYKCFDKLLRTINGFRSLTICRWFFEINPKCYNMPNTGKFSTLVIVPNKLNDLITVKLKGFADEEKEIFMARRLLPLFVLSIGLQCNIWPATHQADKQWSRIECSSLFNILFHFVQM